MNTESSVHELAVFAMNILVFFWRHFVKVVLKDPYPLQVLLVNPFATSLSMMTVTRDSAFMAMPGSGWREEYQPWLGKIQL